MSNKSENETVVGLSRMDVLIWIIAIIGIFFFGWNFGYSHGRTMVYREWTEDLKKEQEDLKKDRDLELLKRELQHDIINRIYGNNK